MDAVIHLACISNDPSFDLDPQLGKSINFVNPPECPYKFDPYLTETLLFFFELI